MMTEGGIRVPMIARLPGTIAANTVSDEAVHVVDLYPTLSEIAQAALPSAEVHPLDGESLAPILAGSRTELERRAIYHHLPGYIGDRAVPSSTIIKDVGGRRYKLCYRYEDGHTELYDLSVDLGESIDLLSPSRVDQAASDVAAELGEDLRDWLAATGAVYPTVRASGALAGPPGGLP
jgi:arylsulfatase A-like enzyme